MGTSVRYKKLLHCCRSLILFFFFKAHWKGYKQRKTFKDRKQYLKNHTKEAVKVKLHS